MSIQCPKCQIPTKPFNFEADLFFDRCEDCNGTWMDKGELARATGSANDFPDPSRATSGPATKMACPKCAGSRLHEVAYVSGSKIIVDVCKQCEGLWLDSREIPQVQEILRKHRIEEKKKKLQGL